MKKKAKTESKIGQNVENTTDQRPFVKVYHDFIKDESLDIYEKMVYIALGAFANENNECFPSIKTLAKATGICIKKLRSTLAKLDEKNIITIKPRKRADGGTSSNLYKINDYKGPGNAESVEEDEKTLDPEEVLLFELAKKKGYRLVKTQEPETLPTQKGKDNDSGYGHHTSKAENCQDAEESKMKKCQDSEKYTKKSILNNIQQNFEYEKNGHNNPCQQQDLDIEVVEECTLEQIHQNFDYDKLVHDNPCQQQDIDVVMSVLYETFNTSKKTIKVAGIHKSSIAVVEKLKKLNQELIMYAIDKFVHYKGQIKNTLAYLLTILYNAPEQYHLELRNKAAYKKAQAEAQAEPAREQRQNKPCDSFSNFEQRTYDYKKLELELMFSPLAP